jgi:hypothetical protein
MQSNITLKKIKVVIIIVMGIISQSIKLNFHFFPINLCFFLHFFKPVIVIRNLIQMSQSNLSCHYRIIISNVCLGISGSVFQLYIHAPAELVDIELIPFNSQFIPNCLCFLCRKLLLCQADSFDQKFNF